MTDPATFARLSAEANGHAPGDERFGVLAEPMSGFETEEVDYLEGFEGFIPRGAPSCIAGEPGHGKSTLAAFIAVRQAELGHVSLFAIAEDSPSHTLRPRLQAAGMTPELEHLIRVLTFKNKRGEKAQLRLPEHGDQLLEAVAELHEAGETPWWLSIDPIGSYVGKGLNNWRDTDMRAVFEPLDRIMDEYRTAVTLNAHVNKREGTTLQERLSNSSAFYEWPRSVMLLARDPDDLENDTRILASAKHSFGRLPTSRAFDIVTRSVAAPRTRSGFVDSGSFKAAGGSDQTVSQLLSASRKASRPGRAAPKRNEAETFLLEFLAAGPVPHAEVAAEAARRAISTTTLQDAAADLGVVRGRESFQGGFVWRLP